MTQRTRRRTLARDEQLERLRNHDAERSVLGAFILEPSLLTEARADGVRPQTFHLRAHQLILNALIRLGPVSLAEGGVHALESELNRADNLDAVGGQDAVSHLFVAAVATKNDRFLCR